MDVLTLYQSLHPAGQIRSKGGGEYCGPCPSCGGDDRFILWPDHSSGVTGGRFMCRGCGVQGDAVEFLRVFRGMTYREACNALRIEPDRRNGHIMKNIPARREWTPNPENFPPAGWMEQAARFVVACSPGIESGPGLDVLSSRSLTVKTAHALAIGWNAADRYDRRSEWGLDEQTNPETGKPLKIWLPRGLVLPIRRKAGIAALLVRRADWKPEDSFPKYWQVKGSGNFSFCIGKPGLPVVVVESVLDAVLVWQEAGDIVATVALAGATKRPDAGTTAFLQDAPLLLWSLDFDEAGRKAWPWWQEHFPHGKPWPVAAGKDPGEMVKDGVPVRAGLEAGLEARQEGNPFLLPGTPETSRNAPAETIRSKDEPKAITNKNEPEIENVGVSCQKSFQVPSGLKAETVRSMSEARDTPHHEHTPKGVDIPDSLHRLAAIDGNIASLVRWGLVPRLEGGQLVLDGIEDMKPEDRDGVERWLAHGEEQRRERVIQALRTGRKAALCG